jgi:signal transduction histidine kinase
MNETDLKFREHVGRLGASGLQTLGLVEIALAAVLRDWPGSAVMAAVGLLTIAAGRARRWPRLAGVVSVWLAAAAAGGALGMMPVAVAAAGIPFLPWQALAMGAGVAALDPPMSVVPALLGAGVAAWNYARRRKEFAAQQEAVRMAETLSAAESRAQLAESAISIGKMAAALSHEINSPLGALRSSIATLCSAMAREIEASPDERLRLERTRVELRRSIEESAARIEEVTSRLRRFANLEDAEFKPADINDLLAEVTALHRDELERAKVAVEFDLARDIPALNCRRELLTAAFSSLLSNAIDAVNGDGRISIATRGREGEVEVTIRDNGRGMSAEEAETIFDPGFKVAAGRVASGNWSLFNSRQIVYEHGGAIRLETAPGWGTAMHITLPVVRRA